MSALYLSIATSGNEQVVRRPRRTDAIGAALRGVFAEGGGMPADMARLLDRLNRGR